MVCVQALGRRSRERLSFAVDKAFSAVERVQRLMSAHDPKSELSRLNREGHRRSVPLSRETFAVVARALRIAEVSGGAFDPTVGGRLASSGYLPRRHPAPDF